MTAAETVKLNGIAAGAQVNVATNLGVTTAATTLTVTSSTGANVVLPASTTALAGLMTAAETVKLNGIAAGAQVNVAANLTYSTATTTGVVNSSTGTNATIPAATTALAGLMTNTDKTKLDGIAAGATANTVIGTTTQVAYNNAGTMAGSANLVFDGTNLTCGGNITANSDERIKTNWRDLPEDFIIQLSGVKHGTYDRLDVAITQDGVSAQALQKVLPNSVLEDENGGLSVAYGNAALVSTIALSKRILEQEQRINKLEELISKLIAV
jgi:hypothetical protein